MTSTLTQSNINNSPPKDIQQGKENQEDFQVQKQQFLQKMLAPIKKKSLEITQALSVSVKEINFGKVLPGNICEEDIILQNTSQFTIVVQLIVVCHNQEYDDLDEYVFSVRKINGYDYNDKLIMGIQPGSTVNLKIALKAPNENIIKTIEGKLFIQAQGFEPNTISGAYCLPIKSIQDKAFISCNKLLYTQTHQSDVIMLAFKMSKKMECKVPFKNNSQSILTFECELLQEFPQEFPYDAILNVQNQQIQPQSQFFMTVTLKPKSGKPRQAQEVKQVLILKIKNSSLHFGFPAIISIC